MRSGVMAGVHGHVEYPGDVQCRLQPLWVRGKVGRAPAQPMPSPF